MSTAGVVRYAAMLGKELLELARSMKLLWVPLVFVALGIMQPVSLYYMPIILEHAGNLPEGAVIEIPTPAAGKVMADTLSQFGVLGLLVLVLVFMGTVSGERGSGTASMILVKPVSIAGFLVSKWTAMLLLACLSLLAGYAAAWYYTELLIGSFAAEAFAASFALYSLWLAFAMTVTLMFSSLLRSAAGAAFCSLGFLAALSLAANLLPQYVGWTPGALSGYAYEAASSSLELTNTFYAAVGSTVLLGIVAFTCSNLILRRAGTIE